MRSRGIASLVALIAGLSPLSACDEPAEPVCLDPNVRVTPPAVEFPAGDSLRLVEQVSFGSPAGEPTAITWFSEDSTVATVTQAGWVRGEREGRTRVGVAVEVTRACPDADLETTSHVTVTEPPLPDLDRDTTALVQTDTLGYTFDETENELEVDIPYRYENRTGDTICLNNCRGSFSIELEKRIEETWETVWTPAIPACASSPIKFAPDSVFRDTLTVVHRKDENSFPKMDVERFDGVYRVNVIAASRIASTPEELKCGGEQLPREMRVSNPFVLDRP